MQLNLTMYNIPSFDSDDKSSDDSRATDLSSYNSRATDFSYYDLSDDELSQNLRLSSIIDR